MAGAIGDARLLQHSRLKGFGGQQPSRRVRNGTSLFSKQYSAQMTSTLIGQRHFRQQNAYYEEERGTVGVIHGCRRLAGENQTCEEERCGKPNPAGAEYDSNTSTVELRGKQRSGVAELAAEVKLWKPAFG